MKVPVSVIILTLNEELNLGKCLENIAGWADEVFVVDSFSTDNTGQIAKRYNVAFIQHPFKNQASQFNWALDNLEMKNEWILRLDADEYLTEELKKEISKVLMKENISINQPNQHKSAAINGFYIKRRVYFMGRWIKHGGYYPTWILRLFRKGKARSEQREMDEHFILLTGEAGKLKNDFIDDNKKDLASWINKHNDYSSREARERIKSQISNLKSQITIDLRGQAARKRWFKEKFYYRLPLFCRAFLYFFYRYFILLGFLDGSEGLIFHFLQGCWHQFLIDAKIYEGRRNEKKYENTKNEFKSA